MITSTIAGIALSLNTEFGDTYKIYTNSVEQGMSEPCFSISVLQPSRTRQIGARYKQLAPFDVLYFPLTEGDTTELLQIAERMLTALEVITLPNGDKVRGTKLSYEPVDGILHFFVHYNRYLIQLVEQTEMDTLTVTTNIAKG